MRPQTNRNTPLVGFLPKRTKQPAAMLPALHRPADPEVVADRVTHRIGELGSHAVKLIPPLAYLSSAEPYDDSRFRLFEEGVEALDVPVCFTMGSGPVQSMGR